MPRSYRLLPRPAKSDRLLVVAPTFSCPSGSKTSESLAQGDFHALPAAVHAVVGLQHGWPPVRREPVQRHAQTCRLRPDCAGGHGCAGRRRRHGAGPLLLLHDTYALEIDHGAFVVRYGAVKRTLPDLISVGARVLTGQPIASIGRLSGGSHMFHFVIYDGSATGPLTNRRSPPYQRRADLMDPTPYLDAARMDADEMASPLRRQRGATATARPGL